VGVDPDAAIPALAARFAAMDDPAEQTKLALAFVVTLLGGRSQEGRASPATRNLIHADTVKVVGPIYDDVSTGIVKG
jgi:hypothetical protein